MVPLVDGWEALQVRFDKAEDRLRSGEYGAALDAYRDLLAARLAEHLRAGNTLDETDGVVAERLADVAVLLGETRAADDLLGALADALTQAGNTVGASYVSLKRALVASGLGKPGPAFAVLRSLEPSVGSLEEIEFSASGLSRWERRCRWQSAGEADFAILLSQFYLVTGTLLSMLGNYANAEAALRRGLHYTRGAAPQLALLSATPLRLALAGAMLEKGELSSATVELGKLSPAVLQGQPGWTVRSLELLATVALLRGKMGTALEHLRHVVQLCEAAGFHGASARARMNLAHALILLNQTHAARRLLAQMEREGPGSGRETAARAAWLLLVADARGRSLAPRVLSGFEAWGGGVEDGDAEGPAASGVAPELPEPASHLALFDDLALAFYWDLGRQDFKGAEHRLTDMRDVFSSCDSELIAVRLAVLSGVLTYYCGRFADAEAVFRATLPRLGELGLKPEEWQALRFMGWCSVRRGRPESQTRFAVQKSTVLLQELADSLGPSDRVLFLLNKWTADEEHLVGEVDALIRTREAWAASPWWRPLSHGRLVARLHDLLSQIDRHKADVALEHVRGAASGRHEGSPEAVSIWRRLLSHPRDRATLTFLVLPDRVVAIVSGWLLLDFSVMPLTRVRLREEVRRWHELASGFAEGEAPEKRADERTGVVDRLTAELGLQALLDRLPDRVRALTLVPDDALHGFPFAAVRVRDRYMIEEYALNFAFSSLPGRRRERTVGNALLVGIGRGTDEYPPLPNIRGEMDAVQRWLEDHGVEPLRMDEDSGCPASRESLMAALQESGFFHAACHGRFAPDEPERSGLLLDPASGEMLTLRDLATLALGGMSHATLSSCWSADSYVLPGRWIVSLPETLCRVGAASVLASLWPLEDQFGRAFQETFYRGLDGLPRDQALRRAQLAAFSGSLPGAEGTWTADPVFWAGLQLYGDPGRLRFAANPVAHLRDGKSGPFIQPFGQGHL